MSKTNMLDRLSKSLQKKPANDLYFPAIDFKDNINFPFSKFFNMNLRKNYQVQTVLKKPENL